MAKKEISVPDIGDFRDVPIVEIHVKAGDQLEVEDPLVTLESDKATMEVPAPEAGRVIALMVNVGDRVSRGTVILALETAAATAATRPAGTPAGSPSAVVPGPPAPQPARYGATADVECEMMVLGGGPGGYSAAFRAADLGMRTVIVERWSVLGGVCLNVGCIPSKALLHTAAMMDEVTALGRHGIRYGRPEIDLGVLRQHKEKIVAKLTGGLAGMAKARGVVTVTGTGRFLDPHHIEVALSDGSGRKVVRFEKAIIAAGSEALRLPFLPEDGRIVDSTGALELRAIPKRLLVIGGGIIGLEMATVYSTLGARVDIVEMLDHLMPGADRDLVKVWEKHNARRFDAVMLSTKTVAVDAKADALHVTFDGADAPKEPGRYDMVLVAVGRAPNGRLVAADKAGVVVGDRGFIATDRQMRTNVAHIFAIGDIVGQPMLAHKAVHEGHVAAEAAVGKPAHFDARQVPSVAYTDPEIAWAGVTELEAKARGIKVAKAVFPWAASGRAIANGRDEGFTKLLFDEATQRIVGGGIVGTHAGDLIGEVCLAIEMGCEPADIGKTIHPHPTLGESIGMAAEVAEGVCTDLLPVKRK
ncbi:MAG: dihydrolipoyl dehydrogenase [Hyphomicrobiaceae bacterium]|nr:MAG: dihydrolipoyl dehydrogenase [Hyphomicrobiaceae bacterium]